MGLAGWPWFHVSEDAVLVYREYQSFLRLGCQRLLSTLVSIVWFKAGSKAPVPPHLAFHVAGKHGESTKQFVEQR
jgi:hypothetical protein